MNHYSQGLRHGYEDAYEAIRKILDEDISDAEKLERIGWQVAPKSPGCVTESTHSGAAGNGVPQLPDSDNDTSQDQGGC